MEEYKESGIDWIGKIPTDWDIQPLGIYFEERREKVSDIDYEALSVTKNGIVRQLENVAKSDAHDDRKKVCQNDFVINSRSDRKQSCGLSEFDGSVSLINIVLKINQEKMYPTYAKYLLDNCMFAEEFYRNGHGIVADLWTTNFTDMKRIFIPLPPFEEQNKVSKKLDEDIPKINNILENLNKQIEILAEYKTRVISNIMKKGLNKNIKLKTSSIEWIDKIPSTWKEVRIGQYSWIRARLGWKGLKAEEYVDNGFPMLSAFNIVNNKMNWENLNFINKYRYDESPEIKLKKNDLILVKDGAGIGKCAIIDEFPYGKSTTNGSLAVISTSGNLNANFLYYYLQTSMYQNFIYRIINGMGVPHLSQEELRKIVIPLPKIDEQKEIVKYLDNKCTQIDNIIDTKQKQIEKLETYKKSLIYEYVTGKKKVKGA